MREEEIINYPEIKPLLANIEGKTNKLMVLLHGLGSDGHDLIGLVPYIQGSLKDYHFIAPHGVETYDMAPLGRQWFSLENRNEAKIMEHVLSNAPDLQKIIEDKQIQLGLKNSDTVLVGFSQGAMIASYLTLTQSEPYFAMIGFSGRLIMPAKIKNTSTPICIIHGTHDDVVEPIYAKEFAEYCKNNNIKHELHLIKNLTHSIDASGLEYAVNFLNKNINSN